MDHIEKRAKFSPVFGTREGYLKRVSSYWFLKEWDGLILKKSSGGFDRLFFPSRRYIKFICFLIPRLNGMHLEFQFWVFYQEHTWNDPFLSFFLKNDKTYTKTKESMFCDCVGCCQIWLWLGLHSGINRCLRAQASFRAQLHCVRSRSAASEVKHVCGCLNGIIGGAQRCPLHRNCLAYSCSTFGLCF